MGLDKTINGFADLSRCCKTGALEGTSGENTEPDFCLIEPRGMGGSVVKMNIFVLGQPPIPFRQGVQIIENDMDLLVRIGCHHLIHEAQKLSTSAPLEVSGLDLARRDLQGRKQGGGAVTFVLVIVPMQRLPIGQTKPALGSFQSLNPRFLIDTDPAEHVEHT